MSKPAFVGARLTIFKENIMLNKIIAVVISVGLGLAVVLLIMNIVMFIKCK